MPSSPLWMNAFSDIKKVKTQIVDLLLCEPNVYIRLLQLGMHIFRLVAVNSPAAALQKNLFEEPPLYEGV